MQRQILVEFWVAELRPGEKGSTGDVVGAEGEQRGHNGSQLCNFADDFEVLLILGQIGVGDDSAADGFEVDLM